MHKQRLVAGLAVLLAAGLAAATTIDPKRMASSNVVEPAAATSADGKTDTTGALEPLLSQDGYQEYMVAVLRAELIADPVKRCLAYPDMPGNEWPRAMVEGLCALIPKEGSLDELDKVLKQPGGGAELDRRYAALLDAHYADPKKKDRIFRAYDIFDESPQAAAVAQEWVRQSRDSAYARTARAWQLVESGWKARGNKLMRDTPADNVKRMDDFFGRSLPDLDFALKQNPRLLPACDRLISIGASSSGLLQEIGSQLCLKADPASYRVMGSLLWANQPKWGGSQEQMRLLVATARAHEADNPTLAALRNFQAGYEPAWGKANGDYARTAPELERVSRLSPGYLQDTSRALINLDRSSDAFVYASQAIRFNPEDDDAFYDRANALRKLNAFQLAIADATRAKALRKKPDGWPDMEIALSLTGLGRYKEAREPAIAAMATPETRGTANEVLCRSYGYMREFDKMIECTEKLVVDYPGNEEAWRLRAVAYKDSNSPKAYDAVDDFLERAHSEAQANEITWFKGWRVEHPRPASAAAPAGSAPRH